MIDPGQPLGHTIVVRVLGLERELEETPGACREDASRASTDAPVRPDSPKSWTTFADQAEANIAARTGRPRRAKDRSDELVVEIRGSHGELSLLQRENSVVRPGGLPESGKRHWVLATKLSVACLRLLNVSEQLRTEQPGHRLHRFERRDLG